jgi:hypothetical protein
MPPAIPSEVNRYANATASSDNRRCAVVCSAVAECGACARSATAQSCRCNRRIHHRHIADRPIQDVQAVALRVLSMACGAPRRLPRHVPRTRGRPDALHRPYRTPRARLQDSIVALRRNDQADVVSAQEPHAGVGWAGVFTVMLPLPPNGVALAVGTAAALVRTAQVGPTRLVESGVGADVRLMMTPTQITPAAMMLAIVALMLIGTPMFAVPSSRVDQC